MMQTSRCGMNRRCPCDKSHILKNSPSHHLIGLGTKNADHVRSGERPECPASLMGPGLHETNLDNRQQAAAKSGAYEQARCVLYWVGIRTGISNIDLVDAKMLF